jgi:multiple sugar transport system substrate-binding protein
MRGGIATMLAVVTLAAAGCGGDDNGGAGSSSAQQGLTAGAKKAPTLEQSKDAKGTITMCAGKDTSGALTEAIKLFNDKYASQGVKVKLLELAADATEVRNQFIQREQAKSSDCDVLQSDIIWIAEFAQQKWLLDMSDYANARKQEFIPSTISSFDYDGKLWGLPQVTGAGLLYRRTDQVPSEPATWQALYADAAKNDGLAYQGRPVRGADVQLRRAVLGGRRAHPLA